MHIIENDIEYGSKSDRLLGAMDAPPHIALRTDFAHHGSRSGYKQLLKFTRPAKIFGINDRHGSGRSALSPWRRYKWLHEFSAGWYARTRGIRLIHILYGEEYFRFSAAIPSGAKVVVTYHQPPDLLHREMEHGDKSGRIYGWAHQLTLSRLRKVDAVIATTSQQRDVLAEYIPEERIHVIPLGCYSREKSDAVRALPEVESKPQILTVGHWRRDWQLYEEFVKYCDRQHPVWRFALVDRNLSPDVHERLKQYTNFRYEVDVDDARLVDLHRQSRLQFLPVESAAGSNALNDSLAYGLPVVTNKVFGAGGDGRSRVTKAVTSGDLEKLADACAGFLQAPENERSTIRQTATSVAEDYDWQTVADRTIELYRDLLEKP